MRQTCVQGTGCATLSLPNIENFGNLYWQILEGRAQISLLGGKHDDALAYLKKAIDSIEAQRSNTASEAYRIGFVGGKQNIYRAMIETLLRSGRTARSLRLC